MADPNLKQHAEVKEGSKAPKEGLDFPNLLERAWKDIDGDTKKDASEIAKLKESREVKDQETAMVLFESSLIEVVARLDMEGADVSVLRSNPKQLSNLVRTYDIELEDPERVSLDKLNELLGGTGATATFVKSKEFWSEIVDQGDSMKERVRIRYTKLYREHPVLAVGLAVVSVYGIAKAALFGVRSIKESFQSATQERFAGDTERAQKNRSLLAGIGIAGLLAGGVVYHKQIKAWLAGLGLSEETKKAAKNAVEKGKELPKKAEEEIKKKAGEQGEDFVEGVKDKAEKVKEENLAAAEEMRKDPEEIEQDKNTSEMVNMAQEKLKTDEGKFEMASLVFIKLFLFERSTKDDYDENEIKMTLVQMKEQGVTMSTIESVFEEHKKNKAIPSSAFPGVTTDISDNQRYLMIKKLINFSKLAPEVSGDSSIEAVFLSVANNPALQSVRIFQGKMLDVIRSGDFNEVLSGVDFNSINQKVREGIENGTIKLVDSINSKLDPALKNRFEAMNEQDKEKIMAAQTKMILDVNIHMSAEDAVDYAFKEDNDEVKQYLIDFYKQVKEQAGPIIDDVKQRYAITSVNGETTKNRLDALKLEKMSFMHATELIVAVKGASIKANSKAEHWVHDLSVLNIALRAMPEEDRTVYLTQLGRKVVDDDTFDIDVPGLKNIVPYLVDMKDLAGEAFVAGSYGFFLQHFSTAHHRPKIGTEASRKQIKDHPVISFGSETHGGFFEMGQDAGAFLIAMTNIEPGDFEDTDTAEKFIDLFMSDPSVDEIIYDREKPGHIAVKVANKWLVMKPIGIMKESFTQLAEWDFEGAVGTWVIGSAPFVAGRGAWASFTVIGKAVKGGIAKKDIPMKIGQVLLEAGRGAKYPLIPFKLTKRSIDAALHHAEVAREASRGGRQALRYGKDFFKSPFSRQNIGNLLETGQALQELSTDSKLLTETTWRDTLHQAVYDRKKLVSRLIASEQKQRAALRTGRRFVRQYNSFFAFADEAGAGRLSIEPFKTGEGIKEAVSNASKAHSRLKKFTQSLSQSPELLEEMRQLGKSGLEGDELIEAMHGLIKKAGGLKDFELEALSGQFKYSKEIERFIYRVEEGAGYFEGRSAGRAAKAAGAAETARTFKTVAEAADLADEIPRTLDKLDEAIDKSGRRMQLIADAMEDAKKAGKSGDELLKFLDDLESASKYNTQLKAAKIQLETAEKVARNAEAAGKIGDDVQKLLSRADKAMDAVDDLDPLSSIPKAIDMSLDKKRALEEMIELAKAAENADELEELTRQLSQVDNQLDHWRRLETQHKAMEAIYKGEKSAAEFMELAHQMESTEKALMQSGRASEALGDVAKVAKMNRAVAILPGIGVIVSAPLAYERAVEAYNEDNSDMAWAAGTTSAIYTVDAGIALTEAGLIIAGSSAATTVGAVAAPLIPLTIVAEGVYESMHDASRLEADWMQDYSPDNLYHQWISTRSETTYGDELRIIGTNTFEGINKEKQESLHEIYKVLVAELEDPSILGSVKDGSKEKLNSMIDESYTKYHEYFFQKAGPGKITSYDAAIQFVARAQRFNRIMIMRETALEAGKPFKVGDIDMSSDDYTIYGVDDNPSAGKDFSPMDIVKASEKEITENTEMLKLSKTLDQLDTDYLIYLFIQISQHPDMLNNSRGAQIVINDLANYLSLSRGVQLSAIGRHNYNGNLGRPNLSLDQTAARIVEIKTGNATDLLAGQKEYEKHLQPSPAVHSLYTMARFFGYNGPRREPDLKKFFSTGSERGEAHMGIYYDGSSWRLQGWISLFGEGNASGAERDAHMQDDDFGPSLSTAMIETCIKTMRKYPKFIISHRGDSYLSSNAKDYSNQVLHMAGLLEKGLAEGQERGYSMSADEATYNPIQAHEKILGWIPFMEDRQNTIKAPEKFDPRNIDYDQEWPALQEDLKAAINDFIQHGPRWREIGYKVISKDEVLISRNDTGTSVKMYMDGPETWNMGHYGGLDFQQAVALANLKNRMEDVVKEKNLTGDGEGDSPFYFEDGELVFGVNWGKDRRMVSGGNWMKYYKKVGLNEKDILSALNDWYYEEGR